jgi:acyl-CoA synthetase (AMP-forming)/AMP-acid ligase II
MNISLLLEMSADAIADRTAIGGVDGGVSYGALLAKARRAASWIAARDVAHVVYLGFNAPAFPILLFASAMAGRPFVPLNYRLPDADLRKLAARTAPSLVVADDALAPRVADVAGVAVMRSSAFLDAIAAAEPAHADAEQEVALLLFTSGTTGEPKAAMLRHRHLTAYVVQTVEFAGASEDEALLVSVPPYHIAGVSAVLTAVYGGRRIVQLPSFSPEGWVKAARDETITHAMVVPTMLGRILDELERTGERLPSLRHLSYGGGRMPVSVVERALALLPDVDFVNAYGLTETSSTIAVLDPEDHRLARSDAAARRRLGSVGRPLPSVEVEIRGGDGQPLGAGEPGEIWVRGEQVSGEYLDRKAIRDDGWLPTNDCGWLDEAGYLYVDGRLDDVIVRGGENISPGEIEEALRAHPAVRDAAVVGLPDDEWGERIAAAIVARRAVDAAELQDWIRARLRSTKVPEEIHFRAELPFNDTGKLLRRELKKMLVNPSPSFRGERAG